MRFVEFTRTDGTKVEIDVWEPIALTEYPSGTSISIGTSGLVRVYVTESLDDVLAVIAKNRKETPDPRRIPFPKLINSFIYQRIEEPLELVWQAPDTFCGKFIHIDKL